MSFLCFTISSYELGIIKGKLYNLIRLFPDINQKRYALLIIDHFSRYVIGYLLKEKSEATNCLKDYIVYSQAKLNSKIITMRCDGGTEFINNDFQIQFSLSITNIIF